MVRHDINTQVFTSQVTHLLKVKMRVTFLAALALMALVAISYAQEGEAGSGQAEKTTGKTPKDDSGENEQAKKNDNGKQSKKGMQNND